MANNGMPSMMALLGLLAVAGYQNRDKIGKMIGDIQTRTAAGNGQPAAGDPLGGLLGGIGELFGATPKDGQPRGVLTKGLDDLMDRFRTNGQADAADSWVTMGVPTKGLTETQVAQAIGEDNISELSKRTGLSRGDLLQRLATAIPQTVDRATPGGNMPNSDDELRDRLSGLA